MPLRTKKMIVLDDNLEAEGLPLFKSPDDIPGYGQHKSNGYANWAEIEEYVSANLHNPRMCLQALETQEISNIALVKDEIKDKPVLLAAFGYKVIKNLGYGKDGYTFLGQRYMDSSGQKYIVKAYRPYAKDYNQHTRLFNTILQSLEQMKIPLHKALVNNMITKHGFMYYPCKQPFVNISKDPIMIKQALAEVCSLNCWTIKHTGFLFWDLGYGNGRNFMLNVDGKRRIKWVDYGGAGMLRSDLYYKKALDNHKEARLIVQSLGEQEVYKAKASLVIANNKFIISQFLLNYLYHLKQDNFISVWSSFIQTDLTVVDQFTDWVLPKILDMFKDNFCSGIYKNFKHHDWTTPNTWKELEMYIKRQTK